MDDSNRGVFSRHGNVAVRVTSEQWPTAGARPAQAQARQNNSIERGGRPEVSAFAQELLAHDCRGKRESRLLFKGVALAGQPSWGALVGRGEWIWEKLEEG